MRGAGAIAIAALLVSACTTSPAGTFRSTAEPTTAQATTSPTTAPTPTRTPIPTLDLPPVTDLVEAGAKVIEANPSPDFAVTAAGYLWVGGVGMGIGLISPAGEVIDDWEIPGGSCGAMDVGFEWIWSATCEGSGLVGLAVEGQGNPPKSIEVGGIMPDPEASVGAGEGAVWMIVDHSPRQLVKVDFETLAVVDRYDIEGSVTAVRAGVGGVWIADAISNTIRRFDPATEKVVATIQVGPKPQFLAVGEGAVWVMNQADGTVSRIDPASNTVVATIHLGETVQGGDIAVGGGYVWLRGSDTLLFKIDPATNAIVARYGPSAGSGSVAADDAAVWITAHDITTIWRLPLR
jgi:YVTN family beta-propeller protein